ncbi:hypothetical protein IVB02_35715 [Bradyrhizobium sp. 166]|uniref:hypothetical protein n=1 Tax=Bradyrhizobium sp. 166 TaxID=2782638 RepID=UPI001FFACDA0|nr:hypothetical protein [Bradyrhizobium sp. 166]MCK1606581.1 hypothetical protein [Bradyrhizobium sp. 166]
MMKELKYFLCAFAFFSYPALAEAEVPAPCRAVGYTMKTFDSDFSRGGQTFDEANSYKPGYQWYRWNWFNLKPNSELAHQNSDGTISAEGGSQGDYGGYVVSAAASPSQASGFVGTAFGGGACVQVKLRFSPVPRTSNEEHPSFWAMSKEHLDGSGDDQWPNKNPGFTHFAEWDILEYYKVPPPGFLSSWIDWFGPYIPKGELRLSDVGKGELNLPPHSCRRPFCRSAGSFTPHPGAFPVNTDWNELQTVIGVWVPATADRPGCIQTFLNGNAIAPPYCWKLASAARERMQDFLDFSVIDRHHMVLVISSGTTPIFARSVEVYQQSGRGNLSN